MVAQKVYIDHSSNQTKLCKVEFSIIIKLENQLVRELMQLYTFAITKYQ
jgi:hypothetical protein